MTSHTQALNLSDWGDLVIALGRRSRHWLSHVE